MSALTQLIESHEKFLAHYREKRAKAVRKNGEDTIFDCDQMIEISTQAIKKITDALERSSQRDE